MLEPGTITHRIYGKGNPIFPATLPETNIFAPENGWLEDDVVSFWVPAHFQGRTVSFRESTFKGSYVSSLVGMFPPKSQQLRFDLANSVTCSTCRSQVGQLFLVG